MLYVSTGFNVVLVAGWKHWADPQVWGRAEAVDQTKGVISSHAEDVAADAIYQRQHPKPLENTQKN